LEYFKLSKEKVPVQGEIASSEGLQARQMQLNALRLRGKFWSAFGHSRHICGSFVEDHGIVIKRKWL